jgi:hypothetical protein
MNKFYVYMYLRSNHSKYGKAESPYYVGKGCEKRAFDKNRHSRPPEDHSRIIFVAENMTEPDAFQLEMLLVFFYGRIDKGTGLLRNLTDGGEGQTGRIQSEEEKRVKSEWMKAHPNRGNEVCPKWPKGKPRSPETLEKQKAYWAIEENRKVHGERLKGKSHPAWNKGIARTEEQRKAHSDRMRGRKQSAESVIKRATGIKQSSLKRFGCTGNERRRMRRRERYTELQKVGLGYQRKRKK